MHDDGLDGFSKGTCFSRSLSSRRISFRLNKSFPAKNPWKKTRDPFLSVLAFFQKKTLKLWHYKSSTKIRRMALNKTFYFLLNVKIHPVRKRLDKKPRMATLQGINISHLGKFGKSSSQNAIFWGDMLVSWRVTFEGHPNPKLWGIWPSFQALFVTSSEACSSDKFQVKSSENLRVLFEKSPPTTVGSFIVPIQNNALQRRNPWEITIHLHCLMPQNELI